MPRKIHFIISGAEGRSRALSVKTSRLKLYSALCILMLVCLSITAGFGLHSILQNKKMQQNLSQARHELGILQQQGYLMLTELQTLRQQKAELFRHEVAKLRERSTQIEEILTQVGVEVATSASEIPPETDLNSNLGGPYYPLPLNEPESLMDFAGEMINLATGIPLGEPVSGWISSGYGARTDPFNQRRAFHYGIDIANQIGTPIMATAAGEVIFAGTNGGYGKMVKIKHPDDYTSIFGHLKNFKVRTGDMVERGAIIGTMGNSGRSTGSHLHYEVRLNDKPINPYPLIFLGEK
ncbi:MAG: peptidoglycan DD-metalloendopeptidase family protein [Desulfuromonadaceae bacterium]|nr:peptidoglycan DD-metalloendopeptidase family protein [Desulfuromonadaceae bacterium]